MTEEKLPFALSCGERREHHDNVSAHQFRFLVDVRHRYHVALDALHLLEADLAVCVLASSELELHANLVAFFEECLRTAQLDVVVVCLGAHAELHFLQAGDGLALGGLLELRLFVLPLSVVDNATYRRVCLGSDFHQVESDGLRPLDRFAGVHHPELFSFSGYHPYPGSPDPFIDPRHVTTRTKSLLLFLSDSFSPLGLNRRPSAADGDAGALQASCQC